MSLAEKQALKKLNTGELSQFQAYVASKGVEIKLAVDEDSVLKGGLPAIEHAGFVLREFRNRLVDMAQDAMAKDALNTGIKQVVVHHDGSIEGEYEYRLEKKNKAFIFTANLTKFKISGSRQKHLDAAMTELL